MGFPQNWNDVERCPCESCQALLVIRDRCRAFDEPMFVCDCRMYGRGFQVGDINKLFVDAATVGDGFGTAGEAVNALREQQRHCDVYLSTWPVKAVTEEEAEYRWSAELHG